MAYPRGSREWLQAVSTADQMVLTLICMSRSKVPELADPTAEPVATPYEHQSLALRGVVGLLASGDEAEALYQYLLSGCSAFTWKTR
jgi:hypothetical protein